MLWFEDPLRQEKIALIWLYQTMTRQAGLTPTEAGILMRAPAVVVAFPGAFNDWCASRGMVCQ